MQGDAQPLRILRGCFVLERVARRASDETRLNTLKVACCLRWVAAVRVQRDSGQLPRVSKLLTPWLHARDACIGKQVHRQYLRWPEKLIANRCAPLTHVLAGPATLKMVSHRRPQTPSIMPGECAAALCLGGHQPSPGSATRIRGDPHTHTRRVRPQRSIDGAPAVASTARRDLAACCDCSRAQSRPHRIQLKGGIISPMRGSPWSAIDIRPERLPKCARKPA